VVAADALYRGISPSRVGDEPDGGCVAGAKGHKSVGGRRGLVAERRGWGIGGDGQEYDSRRCCRKGGDLAEQSRGCAAFLLSDTLLLPLPRAHRSATFSAR
jgi:hypothetical protein